MKTPPPQRFGLSFEVGATLEVKDRHNNWWAATMEQVDPHREKVFVHFTEWRRQNQWIQFDSPNIRTPQRHTQQFVSGSKVMACWTDCRFYPAKILKVNEDGSYTVRFYDGVVLTVKKMKIKPFQESQAPPEEEELVKRRAGPSSSNPDSCRSDDQPITADPALPAAADSAHVDRDVLLQRQSHIPTTHKFSREPLYRVIKKQPPPIMSIDLDHNPFKCPDPGCRKSFRKSSLLHYHIKYYHWESAPAPGPGPGPPGPPAHTTGQQEVLRADSAQKKKKKKKKKKGRSLRVKLKKKKRRKRWSQKGFRSDENSDSPTFNDITHTPDEGSDWSTLTAESGEDMPSRSVAMETDCELVRCVCKENEEKDFMIQCVSCLCLQHGLCFGLSLENVPPRFICHQCTGWRRAQRVSSDCDWRRAGHMFGLSCVKENYWRSNASRIRQTSDLMEHVHVLNQVLIGMKLRMALLHGHPELQWSSWKREESSISSDHSYTQTHNHLLHNVTDTQQEIHDRLELLETQLDALESWLDQSEPEPAAPLSRLPHLKQRIKRLLGDLCVVRKLSVCV